MNLFLRAIAFILCCSFIFSCGTLKYSESETQDRLSAAAASESSGIMDKLPEAYYVDKLPARAGKTDWGLALSGGGIRSATYSIGVMKALYDLDVLDSVDVISSVSGGGYASYWLFTNFQQHSAKTGRFGAAAFANDIFVKNLCELQVGGRFVPVKAQVKSLINATTGKSAQAFDDYERAIWQVFGNDTEQQMALSAALPLVGSDKAPFFIINATVNDPTKVSRRNLFENTVELTPAYIGNPKLGFHSWPTSVPSSVRWSEGITMSAAAVKKLIHRMNYQTASNQADSMLLTDGGHSENLAALSLITRNLKNIIIVDAEHDPDYIFEGYERLRHLLPALGYDFAVPEIDRFLGNRNRASGKDRKEGIKYNISAQSVYKGYARSIVGNNLGQTSTIYYIKMSLPRSLEKQLSNSSKAFANGDSLIERRNELKEKDCNSLAGFNFHQDMFAYTVGSYSDYINNNILFKNMGKLKKLLRYNFPQTTTVDQSYYTDQLEAFVGLGYFQASELKKILDY